MKTKDNFSVHLPLKVFKTKRLDKLITLCSNKLSTNLGDGEQGNNQRYIPTSRHMKTVTKLEHHPIRPALSLVIPGVDIYRSKANLAEVHCFLCIIKHYSDVPRNAR